MGYTNEESREYQSLWRKANPDKVKGYNDKFSKLPKYKKMRKEASKRWVEKNKEHLNAYRRERYRKQKMLEVQA